MRIVCDHEDGLLVLGCCIPEKPQNLSPRVGVKVAGGFVGEDDVRAGEQRTHNGDALLLTTGELFGTVIQTFLQP